MSKLLLEVLRERFPNGITESGSEHGDEWAVIHPERWVDVARFLRDDPRCAMNMFIDLCSVDFPDREPRFEVVAHLYSVDKRHRLRIKSRIGDAEGDGAEIDTLTSVWQGANWFEREAFDMMGIVFRGHPDLRRILLYPEFEGYPLRKDYPANKIQPLMPFREGYEKVAPFHFDEGMSFGRQTFVEEKGN